MRGATNDPTPWPPELPAGENPSAGATIDYFVGSAAHDTITIEIVDKAGRVVRHYSSADRVLNPDPARDPDAYTRVCQENPKAPDCNLPLYWAAPRMALSTAPGMHRMTWDLRYDPIRDEREDLGEDESGNGAVPHRTVPAMDAPWVPPGAYTVRLSGAGKHYEQPLTLKLDPRVTTSPVATRAALCSLEGDVRRRSECAIGVPARARDCASGSKPQRRRAPRHWRSEWTRLRRSRNRGKAKRHAAVAQRARSRRAEERGRRSHDGRNGNAGRGHRADGESDRGMCARACDVSRRAREVERAGEGSGGGGQLRVTSEKAMEARTAG